MTKRYTKRPQQPDGPVLPGVPTRKDTGGYRTGYAGSHRQGPPPASHSRDRSMRASERPASTQEQHRDAYPSQRQPAYRQQYYVPPPPPPPPPKPQKQGARGGHGFTSATLIVALVILLLFGTSLCGLVTAYAAIAADLPGPEELSARSFSFKSTRIYDRDGKLLHELLDPRGGRRIVVPYEEISPYLINATVATEDKRFWQHPGVDPIAFVRAVVQNIEAGGVVSGFSSIPQQLVRLVLFSPEERTEVSLQRKIREAVLASEVSRRYSKRDILAVYLNEINYGSLAYGIEAAADTYFDKKASELNLAESALLAGLPQAPAYWDPYLDLEKAKRRQAVVLDLMAEEGYISQAEADAAKAEELNLQPLAFDFEAPHFVTWIIQGLEQKYGADVLYGTGLHIITTLDSDLQVTAEKEIETHLASLQGKHATNAALVALKPGTGEVLVMVGSADFSNAEISGQVNMALSPRQPGSSIKPVTYVTAFERGWTPATLIWDVVTEFTDGVGRPYVPQNYDRKEHGPVLVRRALAQSLNIPAVKTLNAVGLPAMLDTARRMGITTLDRADYGLSLALGAGEVPLLEMAGAYAVLASQGVRVEPLSILHIQDAAGRVIEEAQPNPGQQVISPQHAYLITDILADNQARTPVFGQNNPLKLSRPAAAKTGTTDDWRDALTIGYTPDLVTAVWVGNADNSAMKQVAGAQGAGPIWHNFMEKALADVPVSQFPRPEGIEEIEISAGAGSLPSAACPADQKRTELFATGQGPLGPEYDFHQFVRVDNSTNALATEYCPANLVEERYYYVLPGPEGRYWAGKQGIEQPPGAPCPVHTGEAHVALLQPAPGSTVSRAVEVIGLANMGGFDHYIVEYGEGQDPIGWGHVAGPIYSPVDEGLLAVWDVRALQNRDYTLRLLVYDQAGNGFEARTWVIIQNASPSPTATEREEDSRPRVTPTPWPTLPPVDTVPPIDTPWPTTEPLPTLPPIEPTITPWPTMTPWPTATPIVTPTSVLPPLPTIEPPDLELPTLPTLPPPQAIAWPGWRPVRPTEHSAAAAWLPVGLIGGADALQ